MSEPLADFIAEQVHERAAQGLTPAQIALRTGMTVEEVERRLAGPEPKRRPLDSWLRLRGGK